MSSTTQHGFKIRDAAIGIRYSGNNPDYTQNLQDSAFENCELGVQTSNTPLQVTRVRLCNVVNPFSSVTEGSPLNTSGVYTDCTAGYVEVPKSTMTATASSYWVGNGDWLPSRAIDSNLGVPCWHCGQAYNQVPGQWLEVNLNAVKNVGRIGYYPRNGGTSGVNNGRFIEYKIFVTTSASTVESDWGPPVAASTFIWDAPSIKYVEFAPKQGQYVIFQCITMRNREEARPGRKEGNMWYFGRSLLAPDRTSWLRFNGLRPGKRKSMVSS